MPAPMTRLKNPHMRTTRVRSIAAAQRGSTLVMPINQSLKSANQHTLTPINLPWATLMCTNSNYPSIDIIDDALLIGRKAPSQLIVNHQAISGIHCRLVRKPKEDQSINQSNATPVISQTNSPNIGPMSAITEDDENESDEQPIKQSINLSVSHHHRTKTVAQIDQPESKEQDDQSINPSTNQSINHFDEKMKRKSRIHVKDMVSIFGGNQADEDDSLVWKGSKNQSINQSINQSRNQSMKSYEVWLEDLSTNGTFINQPMDQSTNQSNYQSPNLTKIGSGNSIRLSTGSEFTVLPSSQSNLSAISFVLRIHGESPVGNLIDEAPNDKVAMVFTDIESSTNLWAADPIGMNSALEEHDRTLRTLLSRFRGYEVKTEGDAFMVAFHTVLDAVKWCLAVQEAFLRMKWPASLLDLPSASKVYINDFGERCESGRDDQLLFSGLRVRMGIHVGQPNCRRNPTTKRMDYFGPMVNLSARVSDSGHGGQIVCTEEVCKIVEVEVARMKEKAEKEWAAEREEDGTDEDEEDVNQSINQTYDPDKPLNQSINQKSPRFDPSRFARIKEQVSKRPTTLDSTLEHLTDLNAVTFVDCGSVELKGINGPTKVYQISSVSLTARRWDPPLRAKPASQSINQSINQTIELGGSAPAPPPLTLTFYTKHNIPLQIRRAIIKNKKEEKEIHQRNSQRNSLDKELTDAMNQSISQSINQSISQSKEKDTQPNKSHEQPVSQSITVSVGHTDFLKPATEDDPLNRTILLSDNQSISQSMNQSINHSDNELNDEADNQSIEELVNQCGRQSINQSAKTRQSTSQSANQSINQTNNQLTDQSINQSFVQSKRRSGSSALAASILAARAINQSNNQSTDQSSKQANKPETKLNSLSADQSISHTANQSINQSTSQSVSQSVNQPINQSINPPISYAAVVRSAPGSRTSSPLVKSINQSINQSISPMMSSRSIASSVNQSINQSVTPSTTQSNKSITQSANQSIIKSTNQSNNQSNNQSITQSNNQSINQSINQTNNQPVNKSHKRHHSRVHGRRPSRSLDLAAEACFAAFDAEIRRRPLNQSINQSINQSTNQSMQSMHQAKRTSRFNSLKTPVVHRPINQSFNQSTLDRYTSVNLTQAASNNQSTNQSINQSINQSVNQAPALAPTSFWGNQSINQWRM